MGSSSTCDPVDSSSSIHGDTAPTPLHDAMRFADLIRKHVQEQSNDSSNNFPLFAGSQPIPGLMDGCVAGLITAVALHPIRRSLVKRGGGGLLLDILLTTTQVSAAGLSALYVGSVLGSRVYLQQLAQIPAQRSSVLADRVCQDALTERMLRHHSSPESALAEQSRFHDKDPRLTTLKTFYAALAACRNRTEAQRGVIIKPPQARATLWWR